MPRRLISLLGLMALLSLAACASNHSAPPPASSGLGAPLAVSQPSEEGWEGDMVFGPYRVGAIQGEKPDQADWRFAGRRGLVMRQAMSFVFSGEEQDWHCRCAAGDDNNTMPLNIGTLWGHGFALDPTKGAVLACVLQPAKSGKTWRMSIYAPPTKWKDSGLLADPTLDGALSDGVAQTILIKAKGVVAVETVGAQQPKVYRFLSDNGELAQVRIQPPRMVFLPSGPLREPLAAAAGAILAASQGQAKK